MKQPKSSLLLIESKTQTNENDIRQHILAQRLSKAGADIIIGHGGRNMKGIE